MSEIIPELATSPGTIALSRGERPIGHNAGGDDSRDCSVDHHIDYFNHYDYCDAYYHYDHVAFHPHHNHHHAAGHHSREAQVALAKTRQRRHCRSRTFYCRGLSLATSTGGRQSDHAQLTLAAP